MSESATHGQSVRNITLLSIVQALAGSNSSIVMTIGGLAAVAMAPNPALVTVPVTAMVLGLALCTSPATMTIYRLGRARGLALGAAIAIPGALLATLAVWLANFYLFCFALFFVGASGAFLQQVRFAAADSVTPDLKSRAISWVLFGGVAAGFFGPQLSAITRNWIAGAEYAAGFLVIGVLSIVTILVLTQTRLAPTTVPGQKKGGRGLGELLRTPDIAIPVFTAAASYALMTLVMVAAPLAMVYVCGHSPDAAGGAIQWHVVAMFAPSFVTGSIIRRLGAHLVAATGMALIIVCALIALNGISVGHFTLALILLGLGWNFGFIGSTALLAESYRPEEAGRVQGANEQIVFGVTAIASIGSGVLLNLVGWQTINFLVIPIAGLAILVLGWATWRRRPVPVET